MHLDVGIGSKAVTAGCVAMLGKGGKGNFAIAIGAVFLLNVLEQVTFVLETDNTVWHETWESGLL